ncbi:hypothetical protein ZIOFF_002946 [Zingiber officinale]|uniref:Deoxyuridine 5'-triphosphate nucleotidohydrolase n=1 Tax=Zingiber officinale TaxID=94328 RepID=A0A8J5IMF0_ZINOF|nr:hypothetical protein ZIOFF_002946 [Zingiber officinale]
MSYINTQATSSYKEALQATEAIEAPSLGFCKPADYKGALSGTIATIKQANTHIQLLVTILEKLESLEDRTKKIEAKANPEIILPNEVIQELSNKIKGLTLKEKAKEGKGKLLVFKDPYESIQISILARGYKGWRNGEANILITRGLVGRLSNTPNVGFAYEVQNVVDYLASHGVRALPGRRYDTRELMGQNWIISPSTVTVPLQPTEYRKNTKTSIKIIKGAVGYDLAVDQDYTIPPQGQELLSIGISIKTPFGTYARIAPRSSYATKDIIIGVGVVNSDYRGEVKILVHNFSNDTLSLKTGECIAQIILECCKTPTGTGQYLQRTKGLWINKFI